MTLPTPYYEREGITIYVGDNREVLPHIEPVHAVVTDPPYGLSFMGKGWDHQVPGVEFWQAISGAMLPGAHLLAFGGTRTYHRMAVAIEDAGYEIRDTLQWLYGSGFPKSHDVSKAIDKAAGAEREVVGTRPAGSGPLKTGHVSKGGGGGMSVGTERSPETFITAPATPAAEQWQGFGTALKPAYEPIIMARSPFKGTVAANVLAHGTGAINVDACRINPGEIVPGGGPSYGKCEGVHEGWKRPGHASYENKPEHNKGRWPANVILDETAAAMLDAQSGELRNGGQNATSGGRVGMFGARAAGVATTLYAGDTGGASRFFYCAKASRRERNAGLEGMPERMNGQYGDTFSRGRNPVTGERTETRISPSANHHPTVKPLALMRYLITMITPPGGIVLDPFMGSGSTLVAAAQLGFPVIGIELSEEYAEIAARRVDYAIENRDPQMTLWKGETDD